MDITQQGNVGSSKGVVFTVNATGFITRPPGAMGNVPMRR
jgi:hypothetical protein